MSNLKELITELCPNGVKYRYLGDICQIRTGKLNANAMDENGLYPFFTYDAKPYRINKYAFDTSAILISGNGQVGHLNMYEGKFNAYQRTYVLDKFKYIEKVYLFYFMGKYLKQYLFLNYKKGTLPYITLPILQKFKVAIPPLEVQKEIVNILDKFADEKNGLISLLKEELAKREKQYKCYRNMLLIFDNDVDNKPLGEIAIVKTGEKPEIILEKSSPELYEYINAGTTKSGYTPAFNCYGDVVTTPSRGQGGIGFVGYQEKNFWLGPLCYSIKAKDKVVNKYLYYYLSNRTNEIIKRKREGGTPALNIADLFTIPVEIPALEVQKKIAKILDKFADGKDGLISLLKKELTNRQKQYEFYRDKLLTFRETKELIA